MMEPSTSTDEQPVFCVCGRLLRDPESVARGLGPKCWRKLHRERRLRRRLALRRYAAPAHPDANPNQLAFELWEADPLPDVLHGLTVADVPTRGLL